MVHPPLPPRPLATAYPLRVVPQSQRWALASGPGSVGAFFFLDEHSLTNIRIDLCCPPHSPPMDLPELLRRGAGSKGALSLCLCWLLSHFLLPFSD